MSTKREVVGRPDWRRTNEGLPDWIPDDRLYLYPGSGRGQEVSDWIPDPEAPPEVVISKEQEMYGIGWRPGMPEIPFSIDKNWKKKRKKAEADDGATEERADPGDNEGQG